MNRYRFFSIIGYACAFLFILVSVKPAQSQSRIAALNQIIPGYDRYGSGGRLHATCTSDADCSSSGNNPTICKTLTVNYANGSSPYVTRRCEATHCPSPFANFMLNGNPGSSPQQIADILNARGPERNITFNFPSPAVLPWDPRQEACTRQERDTAAPCTVP